MKPELDVEGLKNTKFWEHAVRFLFGGAVTVAASVITKCYGSAVGGLFLAFPAILPASLTLVKKHDGRGQAVDDARGGRLGSAGLIAFALVVWATACEWPPVVVLTTAAATWLAVDVSLWAIVNRGPEA